MIDPYKILSVSPNASDAEIRTAYRELVKVHHPDAGGDQKIIVSINAAWQILRDKKKRTEFDQKRSQLNSCVQEAKERGIRNARATAAAKQAQGQMAEAEDALIKWLKEVYSPIDRLLGQVINPFPTQLRDLSADPYDDILMESFCSYLEKSQKKLQKVDSIYRSFAPPNSGKEFALNLYHCLSQVQDALNEIERYTMGYVDSYLHDGREMLKEAKQIRLRLHQEHRRLNLS